MIGLYPFQAPRPPEPGFALHGRMVPDAELATVDPEDWPLSRYRPRADELAGSATAMAKGLLLTWAIARIGREPDPASD